jgi:hypothetical protein
MKPRIRLCWANWISTIVCGLALLQSGAANAAVIGIDAIHGFRGIENLATGAWFEDFRSTITGLGHTLVPLSSFEQADLAGIDTLIVKINYDQNNAPYLPSEMAAIEGFTQRGVAVSDSNLWTGDSFGGDTPISFGDNQLLLTNSIDWLTGAPGGLLALGDDGTGFEVGSFNALMSPFGVSFASSPTSPSGHTVTGILGHPITAGVTTLGVDFQIPLTIDGPALDLTIGSGDDNILAAFAVPEPSTGLLVLCGLGGLACRRRQRG